MTKKTETKSYEYLPIDCFDIADGASDTDDTKLPVESYLVNCRYCISSAIASICFNFSGYAISPGEGLYSEMSVTKYKLARNTKRSCVSCNSNSATDPKTSSDAKKPVCFQLNIML